MVNIELDKPRVLDFKIRDLMEAEKRMGKPLSALVDKDSGNVNLGFSEVVIFLYCGLRFEDRTVTIEKVQTILDEYLPKSETGFGYVAEKLGEALMDTGFFGKKEEKKPAE